MKPTTRCGQNTSRGVITTTRRWSLFGSGCRQFFSVEHEFGVRALGTLAASAGTGVVYLVSWHLFGSRAEATFAGLLFCAMLLISAGAIIVTPDTPLLFFWSIAFTPSFAFTATVSRLVGDRRCRDGLSAAIEVYGFAALGPASFAP